MTKAEENLEILQNLSKILARIAKNPVNIAIFTILNQTTQNSGLTIENTTKQIYETFGKGSFGEAEISYRINELASKGWIRKFHQNAGVIKPRYEFVLTDGGKIIANFCQQMLGILNANILKEE